MTATRIDLGERTDATALDGVLDVAGLSVIDVGCGPGVLSRELAARGATVLGVEPDPVQAEMNRAADPPPGLVFVEAGAQALPVETASVDGVIFSRSLHHVPIPLMDAALAEAARVLRPGGCLCVIEPVLGGSNHALMLPFHDETEVRTAALAALARTTPRLFGEGARYAFMTRPRHVDFPGFVARMLGMSFNNLARERLESEGVRARFEAGRTAAGDYAFEQPHLMDIYRKPAT